MKVAVVKYNAGNIRSVDYALKRLGVEAVITADKEELQSADKVIFPGVGEAETTMNHLKATGLDEEEFVYFVHSFYVPTCDFTAATTDYIHPFSAALHKDNFYATQFHPEKSGKTGEKILTNFLNL